MGLPYVRQHKYTGRTIDADIDEGLRIQAFARIRYGAEATADLVQQAAGVACGHAMPYGFYRKYIEEELNVKYTHAKRQALRRSFQEFAERTVLGAATRVAFRGIRKRGSYRGSGGKNNF